MLQHKCKDVGVNMEDKELVKMFNLTLKRRETILFFLIVVINGLTWIVLDIGLDTCARERWRVEVKIERFLGRKGVLSGGALGLLQSLANQGLKSP